MIYLKTVIPCVMHNERFFFNFRVEETERLENVGDRECAFYGLKRNGELTLFTADCKTEFEVGKLCAGKGEWG